MRRVEGIEVPEQLRIHHDKNHTAHVEAVIVRAEYAAVLLDIVQMHVVIARRVKHRDCEPFKDGSGYLPSPDRFADIPTDHDSIRMQGIDHANRLTKIG